MDSRGKFSRPELEALYKVVLHLNQSVGELYKVRKGGAVDIATKDIIHAWSVLEQVV